MVTRRRALLTLLALLLGTLLGASATARTIEFSGYLWDVKAGSGMNPGPNDWSDSTDNVWVDALGRLHLKITHRDSHWQCAEVYTQRSFGYGEYRFYVVGRVDLLDPNVVAGLFTYNSNTEEEMDIEFSRFGDPGGPNGSYCVYLDSTHGHCHPFSFSLAGTYTTHRFIWDPARVHFKSVHGHCYDPEMSGPVIEDWEYTGPYVSTPSDEKVHINFWLFQGNPPSDSQEVELVVTQVSLPPPPSLAWLGEGPYASDGVDPDRANILDWYTFKVKYTGGPPAHVRLHLFRYGAEVAGSPMDMSAGAGDPATGQTWWKKRRLCKGTYSYYFSASDGVRDAIGPPTQMKLGPIVHNRPPRLEWAGYGEWTTDPVDPQGRQMPHTEFTWKIKYVDREADPPQYVRLHVARRTVDGGVHDEELAASPFDMTEESSDYMNGAVFTYTRQLHAEGRYLCWFEAKENAPAPFSSEYAYGVPTWWHRGGVWVFNVPPRLMWAPGADYRGDTPPDGLHPNTGNAGDTFNFKVQYRDAEAVQPDYVRLHLLQWNGSAYVEVGASPFAMTTTDTDFTLADYSVQVQRNSPGSFRYCFSASDGDKDAIGEPSWHRMPGPIVDGTSSAQVGALSCCPTSLGAQVSFTLSADANVTAEVLNIAGRPVQLLVADRAMAAGLNTLTWNGRSASGLAVPSGVYLVRVRAASESGGQGEVLGTLSLLR